MPPALSAIPKDQAVTLALEWEGTRLELSLRHTKRAGETVLLIHGLGCAKESFDGAWQSRLADGLALVSVDLPGFGASSRPQAFSYTMEDQARVLLSLLDELGADRVHLVCHSMGGAVALLLARLLGPRLASLVNVEGNLLPQDSGMISRRAAAAGWDKFQRRTMPALRKVVAASSEPAMAHLARWLTQADPRAFWRSSVSLVFWSDSGELLRIYRELEAPKRYVYGSRSVLKEVLRALEGTDTAPVAGSGHFVMQDGPDAFWPLVEETVLGSTSPPA